MSAPARAAWLQVARKVMCWYPRGARKEQGVEWGGECKDTGTLGVGVAVGGRRSRGRAVEEVLGPGCARGSCRPAGSDLNQRSCRLLAAAAAPRRRRTCRPKQRLEEALLAY